MFNIYIYIYKIKKKEKRRNAIRHSIVTGAKRKGKGRPVGGRWRERGRG
jgi:hypothetical protein